MGNMSVKDESQHGCGQCFHSIDTKDFQLLTGKQLIRYWQFTQISFLFAACRNSTNFDETISFDCKSCSLCAMKNIPTKVSLSRVVTFIPVLPKMAHKSAITD